MIDYIESDARRGLEVMRYHTWPVLRRQSVGEHSAQAMRILLAIWPTAPRHMLVHCLMHDMGEMAGDMPWPGKRNDPVLRERMERAEAQCYQGMIARWRAPELENSLLDGERQIFKLAECIEMWEYAVTELNMGNRYAEVVAQRMLNAAHGLINELEKHPEITRRSIDYIKRRQAQEQLR